MRRNSSGAGLVAALFLSLVVRTGGAAPASAEELAEARQRCIAMAQHMRAGERAAAAIEHRIELLAHDADGRQRGLDDSRPEQQHLLSVLTALSRDQRNPLVGADLSPIDRSRAELLLRGLRPLLQAEAHALSGEYRRIAALRNDIAGQQRKLEERRAALDQERAELLAAMARRSGVIRQLRPDDAGLQERPARMLRDAKDIGALIERADTAVDRRDKDAPASRAGAVDPMRPATLQDFVPPQSALIMPVSGSITESDATDPKTVRIAAAPGAPVVAPFDGRVIYAAPFRDLGLVLIVRHSHGYHSVLAGIGQANVVPGDWVLAGEPVGINPDAADGSGRLLLFELRRDGQPVDPQPWLAMGDPGRDDPDGDQRVRK